MLLQVEEVEKKETQYGDLGSTLVMSGQKNGNSTQGVLQLQKKFVLKGFGRRRGKFLGHRHRIPDPGGKKADRKKSFWREKGLRVKDNKEISLQQG